MAFALFLLVNAVLFIRPAEVFPALEGLWIYQAVILACAAACPASVLRQFQARDLAVRPLTVCVLGMLAAVVLSHLANGSLWDARMAGADFGKVALYFLLLLAVVDSPVRLRRFVLWLVGFVFVLTMLTLLRYWGGLPGAGAAVVAERGFDPETGAEFTFGRLCGFGIFNDPNDLCLILVTALTLGVYQLADARAGLWRFLWLVPLALFAYAVVLTQSRGGLLALLAGGLVFCGERFGWRKTGLLAVIVVPVMFGVAGGRQVNLNVSEGTGQARLQLWSEGLAIFRTAPLFGVGVGRYEEMCGLVAHNSFVHAYTELGMLGGTIFVGAFYLAFAGLRRAGRQGDAAIANAELHRLRPYLLAVVAAAAVGMMSLTRTYTVPTYLVIGLAAAYLQAAGTSAALPAFAVDGRLVGRLALVSVSFLVCTYMFINLFVRY